uniref:TauD domain-containing protein n=1 Tax=Panagrellus redivivus TaxID=6233 RepID=A0A7E4UUC6_PANRE
MLHIYQWAAKGGLSMFVDGFKIADIMRKNHPEAFKILTETQLEYIEEGYDIHERNGADYKFTFDMTARHRVIKLDEKTKKVIKIQF